MLIILKLKRNGSKWTLPMHVSVKKTGNNGHFPILPTMHGVRVDCLICTISKPKYDSAKKCTRFLIKKKYEIMKKMCKF